MYKRFFGLRANPFNMNPDPRYLFLTRHTEEALACLTYGIQSRKGFVLLTGEVGTGKTTLVNKLLEWLRLQHIATAFVFNPRMDVPEFLEYMLSDFGIQSPATGKSQTLRRLYNWLLDRHRAGETSVLIVDEAQNLTDELLEEIRLLTNLETFTEKLLQVVLVGQPELEAENETAESAAAAAAPGAAGQDACAVSRGSPRLYRRTLAHRGRKRETDFFAGGGDRHSSLLEWHPAGGQSDL